MAERTRGRPPHPDVLTPAEWNVLRYVRQGLTNAEIAVRLGISPDGVKYHISNMLAKAGAGDRRELAKWKPRPARQGSRVRAVLAAAGAGAGVATLLGVGAVAVAFFNVDNGEGQSLPDLAATRRVESFVIERTTMILPEHLGIPNIPGEVRNVERVRAVWPDRDRFDQLDGEIEYSSSRVGNVRFIWQAELGFATRTELPFPIPDLPLSGWPSGGSTLEEVVANVISLPRAQFVGTGVQADREVYLVEGKPAECAGLNGGRIELAIDTETLFVLRHAVYAFDTGELVHLQEVTSIEYDVAVPDSLFAPPPGLRVEDLAENRSVGMVSGETWFGSDAERPDCY